MTAIRNNARAIIIRNDRHIDEILLVDNLRDKFYFLPGGGIDFGETVAETITREFVEETGTQGVQSVQPIGLFENIFTINGKAFHTIEHCVTAQLPHYDIISIEDHIAFQWLPLSELTSIRFYPTDLAHKILDWHKDGQFILGTFKE